MIYTIEKVATLIGAHLYGKTEATVGWLLTDSRSLCFPEQTLFFALRTQRNDGHRYIAELYGRGVRAFVVEQVPDDAQNAFHDAAFLLVTSPLAALQRLAERHREEFDIPVVGITGSNGKTWVKEWLHQLLVQSRKVTRSPKSYNSQIGVPLSVWLLAEHTQVALFEAGISQPGEMHTLHDIIQPTIGVLTSLGTAHQENFRSMEEKCMEKLQLFHDTKALIYPSDNDVVSRCVRRMDYQGERIGWSRVSDQAPFYVTIHGNRVDYRFKGVEGSYTLPYIDEASIENSVTCAATALYLGLTPDEVAERMAALEPIAMRLEVKNGQHGLTLINDTYNSDVNSLHIALDFMNRRPDHQGKNKTLILSDIRQTGIASDELYGTVANLLKKRGVARLIGIGPEISASAGLFEGITRQFFDTTEAFLDSDTFRSLRDEVVLLKGARSFGFERIVELLEQKVHETILEVDLNAVVANLNHYRAMMKPGTKMVCMIKADAYGAGAVEIAKTLQDQRVDYLAVAVADEGVELRKAGITQNIIVMNPEMSSFKTIFDYDLEPEVYSFRLLEALIRASRQQGITQWPVHIKLDTGMHRLGFDPMRDIDTLVDRLQHQSAVMPRSVFSHLVGSDSDDFDAFSQQQFRLFDEASRRLQSAFPHKILRHIDNSAGIDHFPDYQMDMCRLGIGLYGVDPRTNDILSVVSTLKTTILQIRDVKAGDSVGYSRRTVLQRDSRIAAIPIGYADGLDRHLGNRHGCCWVNGHQAPYVGNICMDVALVDVTGIPCQEGDSVEIFGRHLPVTAISQLLDTIPYEVLTGVSNRVKRVYYQD